MPNAITYSDPSELRLTFFLNGFSLLNCKITMSPFLSNTFAVKMQSASQIDLALIVVFGLIVFMIW